MILKNDPHIIFLDEFSKNSTSPNSKIMSDFIDSCEKKHKIKYIFLSKNHTPGGLKTKRILNIFLMIIFVPFYLLYIKYRYRNPIVTASTSPPGLHLIVSILNHFLSIKTVVWYFDAHPEIECLIFDKMHLALLSLFFRKIEKIALNYATKIICLDGTMKDRLETFIAKKNNIEICPPWSTYIQPVKSFRPTHLEHEIKMLYAGNYGKIHCLKELVSFIDKMTLSEQKNITIDFIGINKEGINKITKLFKNILCKVEFIPRKDSVFSVIELFPKYHFGLVCLNASYKGLGCPSKALTYVSQGLPIYYIGPQYSLPEKICCEGFGVDHSLLANLSFNSWREHLNQVLKNMPNISYPDIKKLSLLKINSIFENIIES